MFGSEILETAIGVIFLFTFLSLFVSVIQEFIQSLWQTRAINLFREIRFLFGDQASETAKKFFDHSMIKSLFRGSVNFAGHLKEGEPLPDRKLLPAYIPAKNFARAAMSLIDEFKDELPQGTPKFLNDLHAVFRKKINATGDNIEDLKAELEAEIEAWYESVMERMSAVFKKNTQWFLFAIGFVLAAFLNFDTLRVVEALYENQEMRTAIVAEAEAAAENGNTSDYYASLGCKPGTKATDSQVQNASFNASKAELDCLQKRLDEHGLPIGWDLSDGSDSVSDQFRERPTMLIGWLLTAFAMCFGATFWFDMLNKVINVRSTLRPKPTEAAKPGN